MKDDLLSHIESQHKAAYAPLAERMRPNSLDQVVGQEHLVGERGMLTKLLASQYVPSLILWGPPGCGKTTMARLIAQHVGREFLQVSAVSSGVVELKKYIEEARAQLQRGKRSILFVDEIHRFNRAQQDVLLPFVEDGSIVLVGATTENPSFEVNGALLSRCKVLSLKRLDEQALQRLMIKAEEFMAESLPLTEEARLVLAGKADGDGRYLLSLCEALFAMAPEMPLSPEELGEVIQERVPLYDKHQDSHYNLISALHKSLRGSDVDASLYWCQRMLTAGEDPMYVLRRLIRFAVEDVAMADPQALTQAIAAKEAFHMLGSPEGELAITQLVIYLATAPKSNAAYRAYKASLASAKSFGSLMPPKHILNAPTSLMKSEGYGAGYQYDHDTKEGVSGQNYFPDQMDREQYYSPVERGFEREIKKRLDYFAAIRARGSKKVSS